MFVNRAWVVNIGIYTELAQEHLPSILHNYKPVEVGTTEAQVTLTDRQLAPPVYSFKSAAG